MKWLYYAKKFLASERGAGSVFMVIMLPATLALAGLAIDAAGVYQEHGKLQATADAAALAGAADLPDIDQARATAIAYAQKNMPAGANGNVLANADVVTGNWNPDTGVFTPDGTPVNSLKVVAKRSSENSNPYPTAFLGLIGIDNWNVSAEATATSAQSNLWVSLVLDNTGSMCQPYSSSGPCPGATETNSKIGALMTAATNLLGQLENASNSPGDVMASIVPFTTDVNVGTGNAGSAWLSTQPATPAATTGPGSSCPWTDASNGYHCQKSPSDATKITTISSSSYDPYKGYICPSSGTASGSTLTAGIGDFYNGCFDSVSDGHGGYSHTWHPTSSTWAGCVTDRNKDYDAGTTTPDTSIPATLFPEDKIIDSNYCPVSMVPLTDNWTTLDNKVKAMAANGGTNQTIGFVWGWQSLTQGTPLNPPEMPDGTRRYVILLSDGLNTQDRWYGNGHDHSTQVDDRTELACDHAKAEGITIYTVYVDLNGATGSSAVLDYCASDPKSNHYFDLKTPGEIITTFKNIGSQLTHLRLVH